MKITRYQDVPQFTRDGQWQCDYDIVRANEFIAGCIDGKHDELRLNIDPDFQRAHVWTEAQQVAWLEFFMRGGKTGRVIYLNHPGWNGRATRKPKPGDFVLVDGKQRVEAIRRFVAGEVAIFGSKIGEFTDNPRVVQSVKININTLQTRAEVLQWYIDMNAGGTPHTDEEIDKVRALLAAEHASA